MSIITFKGIKILPCLVLLVSTWGHLALAADLPLEGSMADGREVPLLYEHLSQNIEEEASHYSEYIHYQQGLRLRTFWRQLEHLNLNRDEIIQTIALLEEQMEGHPSADPYRISSAPFTSSGAGYLSNIFSDWRPFYFLISGGFFLIISSILLFYYCLTCRENVLSMIINGLQSLFAYDHLEIERSHPHQNDDLSYYRHQQAGFSYCISCRKSVLPTMIHFLKGLSGLDRLDSGKGDQHQDDLHKEAV